MRTSRIAVLLTYFLAVSFPARGAIAPAALSFEKVSPTSAPPGGKVTLVVSADAEGSSVYFGGKEAKVESVTGPVLYVTVPEGLAADETPPITVKLPTGVAATWLDFKVEAPATKAAAMQQPAEPLSINAVAPESAAPGGRVTLWLSRPLEGPRDSISIYFGDVKAPPSYQGGRKLETTVPTELEPGDRSVVVVEKDLGTAPIPFRVEEARLLGIPRSLFFTIVGIAAALGGISTVVYRTWKDRFRYAQLTKQYEVIRSTYDTPTNVEVADRMATAAIVITPEIPLDLPQICAARNCLLFAGPGLGAQARFPTRYEALAYLIRNSDLDDLMREQLGEALKDGQLAFVTEVLSVRIPRDDLITALQTLYADENVELSEAHRLLQRIPFSAALTTGWDGLIERAFEQRRPVVLTGETDLEQANRDDVFFIARLNGDLYVPESFVFSSEEYKRTLYERPSYASFVASQVFSRSILFVGMSLSGIEDFFNAFRFPVRANAAKSYAIVPMTSLWEAQQERFRARYGVELIGYQITPGHTELVKFLAKLEKAVSELAGDKSKEPQMSAAKLRRVELTNIGPFAHLVLDDLQSGWNVLLGNNGTGKSTVLRAIALGLCGESPEAAIHAQKLLRRGSRSGRIALQVGDISYEMELFRELTRVFVRSTVTPLQNGNWVVLGFPALRGVSSRDPSGPTSQGMSSPHIADLIPLIRGNVDTRLDSLKDWLVNLWVRSRLSAGNSHADAQRYENTMASFFEVLRRFTPGQLIEPGAILDNGTSWSVNVRTEDGEIPIDAVSQGMSSIFGWVGTLVQRMHEINPTAEDATKQPALVLVDEIDAHLHPEWQQKLTGIVRRHFPNLQILATTHSPLIVAGMKQAELFIAWRHSDDPSIVTVSPSLVNPEGLRADQILTTPLFGLDSSRDPEIVRKIDQYTRLLGKELHDDQEKIDFERLKNELSAKLLYGESELDRQAERHAMEQSKQNIANLATAISQSSAETKARLREEL